MAKHSETSRAHWRPLCTPVHRANKQSSLQEQPPDAHSYREPSVGLLAEPAAKRLSLFAAQTDSCSKSQTAQPSYRPLRSSCSRRSRRRSSSRLSRFLHMYQLGTWLEHAAAQEFGATVFASRQPANTVACIQRLASSAPGTPHSNRTATPKPR